MIVCLCHRVSDRDIRAAAAAGCQDFEELQDRLRVATACGACHECARECFDQLPPGLVASSRQGRVWPLQAVQSAQSAQPTPA